MSEAKKVERTACCSAPCAEIEIGDVLTRYFVFLPFLKKNLVISQ